MRGMATKVPTVLPRLVKTTTRSTRVTLLRQKPRTERMSLGRSSKSMTRGFFTKASTRPETHPAATMGLREVRGAAATAETTVAGWARAAAAPSPAKTPLATTHEKAIRAPASAPPPKNPTRKIAAMRRGRSHLSAPERRPLGGISSRAAMSISFSQPARMPGT
ncbi:uncharacterized protein Dmul_31840 [Desulfococcus multivorans]|nr:uncharacterized protein Dmul_31840 [Desulfococcus multivorans]